MAPLWRLGSDVLGDGPAPGATRFQERLEADERASTVVAGVLPDSILTISFSSTVLDAIRLRRPGLVVCMRSEPGGEGRRTAEAMPAGTRSEVIEDEEALHRLPAAAVLTGADAVTPDAVVNKVRTRALVEAAAAREIPRYAVAGETKFVAASLPVGELFEPTPLELFTAVATPMGLLSPSLTRRHAQQSTLHPDLAPLLAHLSSR
jgi:translation initiation factor 2B subunit (eIF-2B alpha/beta/delta family)